MGGTYGNVVSKDVSPDKVVSYLQQSGRNAMVSQEVNACCVIFEEQIEFNFPMGKELALELSDVFLATTLYFGLHDNDVLVYWLCKNGVSLDAYDSNPGFFEEPLFTEHEIALQDIQYYQSPLPEGGNANTLCAAFKVSEAVVQVERILRSKYHFETDRHKDLVQVLGIPIWSVFNGYRNVARGEFSNGLDTSMLAGRQHRGA